MRGLLLLLLCAAAVAVAAAVAAAVRYLWLSSQTFQVKADVFHRPLCRCADECRVSNYSVYTVSVAIHCCKCRKWGRSQKPGATLNKQSPKTPYLTPPPVPSLPGGNRTWCVFAF